MYCKPRLFALPGCSSGASQGKGHATRGIFNGDIENRLAIAKLYYRGK
jgi:hypothetical protein